MHVKEELKDGGTFLDERVFLSEDTEAHNVSLFHDESMDFGLHGRSNVNDIGLWGGPKRGSLLDEKRAIAIISKGLRDLAKQRKKPYRGADTVGDGTGRLIHEKRTIARGAKEEGEQPSNLEDAISSMIRAPLPEEEEKCWPPSSSERMHGKKELQGHETFSDERPFLSERKEAHNFSSFHDGSREFGLPGRSNIEDIGLQSLPPNRVVVGSADGSRSLIYDRRANNERGAGSGSFLVEKRTIANRSEHIRGPSQAKEDYKTRCWCHRRKCQHLPRETRNRHEERKDKRESQVEKTATELLASLLEEVGFLDVKTRHYD